MIEGITVQIISNFKFPSNAIPSPIWPFLFLNLNKLYTTNRVIPINNIRPIIKRILNNSS